jgi:hypothetical protein
VQDSNIWFLFTSLSFSFLLSHSLVLSLSDIFNICSQKERKVTRTLIPRGDPCFSNNDSTLLAGSFTKSKISAEDSSYNVFWSGLFNNKNNNRIIINILVYNRYTTRPTHSLSEWNFHLHRIHLAQSVSINLSLIEFRKF